MIGCILRNTKITVYRGVKEVDCKKEKVMNSE